MPEACFFYDCQNKAAVEVELHMLPGEEKRLNIYCILHARAIKKETETGGLTANYREVRRITN